MKYGNTLVSLSKNAFKASLILFIIGSSMMIYVAVDAEPSFNTSHLDSGQTIYTYPIYRETGEKFQLYVGLTGSSGDYEDNYYQEVDQLKIVIYQSESYDFVNSIILSEFTSDGIYRQIESVQDAYYRVSVTNLLDRDVEIITGDAHANMGLLVVGIVAAIMLGISVALFSTAFSLTLTGLVLFGIGYPLYLIVKQEQDKQKSSEKQVYYPRGYNPDRSASTPAQSEQSS